MTNAKVQIAAKVERIIYPKQTDEPCPSSQFYIVRCDVGTVKGRLNHVPKIGECLVLDGSWGVSKFNGSPEFSFFHASVHVPIDPRALLHYACEMTPGFGPSMEERIWLSFGESWMNHAFSEGEVSGLTPSKINALRSTMDFIGNNVQRTTVLSRLISIGLTVKMAEAAFEKWGASTLPMLDENPYILTSLPGYGFRDADIHVRRHYAIAAEDPRRVNAAISYFIRQLTADDTVVGWQQLSEKAVAALAISCEAVSDAVRTMFKSGRLVAFPESQGIALARDYECESGILRFASMPSASVPHIKARQPRVRDFDLSEEQLSAVQFALDRRFSIVNGGAGVGKTSIVRAICDSIGGRSSVLLCSFAGKAAARLREASCHKASTIHSMLGYKGEKLGFTVKSLAGSTVVLDEASMVSSDLMYEIVKRSPDRLILVGDEAQLPPVGSGQPFHDLINVMPDCVRTLSVCYRNREAVFSAALAIRGGSIPPPSMKSTEELYEAVSASSAASAHQLILQFVRSGGIDFSKDIILCCRNGDSADDPCTIRALNSDIKAIVNPGNGDSSPRISIGDRVICTNNSPELDVWNGTTGQCAAIDSSRSMWVDLDFPTADGRKSVLIPREKVCEWILAYALTVHKAQGSQYRKVLFAVTSRDSAVLLDRPMAYTAVTRAKRECRIVGDCAALARAIASVRPKRTVIRELSASNLIGVNR